MRWLPTKGCWANREQLIATMGPEGYAKALAAAAEKAEQATAAYRAVLGGYRASIDTPFDASTSVA